MCLESLEHASLCLRTCSKLKLPNSNVINLFARQNIDSFLKVNQLLSTILFMQHSIHLTCDLTNYSYPHKKFRNVVLIFLMVLVDAPNNIGKYHNEEVKTKLTTIVIPTKNM
jgi:hypothetical protein